ncbi:MAG: leucine-rich repeat domain-containing protein [Eubacteriales bacterium]
MRKEITVTSEEAREKGFEWRSNGESITITGYKGRRRHIQIPWFIDDLPVVEVKESAFCKLSLLSVKIPDTLEVIGAEAFEQCENLRCVHLGYGVKEINDQAFSRCSALESIKIPASVEMMGNYVFYECSSLLS